MQQINSKEYQNAKELKRSFIKLMSAADNKAEFLKNYKSLLKELESKSQGIEPKEEERSTEEVKTPSETKKDKSERDQKVKESINSIWQQLQDIETEDKYISKSWIWVKIDKSQKDKIKAIESTYHKPAKWSKNKELWYFCPIDSKTRRGQPRTEEEIKSKYGAKSL